jgi:hypothetical protein
MGRRRTYAKIKGWAEKEYATHVMTEGKCVSRCFRRSDGNSFHHFNLTWVPGTVSLSGDQGDLSLVHCSALNDFRKGMEWLAGGSYSYLMEKASGRNREYDRDGTVDELVEMANSEIVDGIRRYRDEVRAYRRASAPGRAQFCADFDEWFELGMVGAPPLLEDYDIPDQADYVSDFVFITERDDRPWWLRSPDRIDERRLPANCHLWFAMWKELDATDDPRDIFTSKGRRQIRQALECHLTDGGQERAVDFSREIGLSDYYGCEKWSERTIWQIEALRFGARAIVAEFVARDRKWRHLKWLQRAALRFVRPGLRRKTA